MARVIQHLLLASIVIIGICHLTWADAINKEHEDTHLEEHSAEHSFVGKLRDNFLSIQKRESDPGDNADKKKKKKNKKGKGNKKRKGKNGLKKKKNGRAGKGGKGKKKGKKNKDAKKKKRKGKKAGKRGNKKGLKKKKKGKANANKGKKKKNKTRKGKGKGKKNKNRKRKGKKNKKGKKKGKGKKNKNKTKNNGGKNKKGKNIKKKNNAGTVRQSCSADQASTECFLSVNETMFFDTTAITNFLKQYNRVNSWARIMRGKLGKKDIFAVTAEELDQALGGKNGSNITCGEHNSNTSAVASFVLQNNNAGSKENEDKQGDYLKSATSVYEDLMACEDNVQLYCDIDAMENLTKPILDEMDRCQGLMQDFQNTLKDCGNIDGTSDKCACYLDHSQNKLPALKNEKCNSFMANLQQSILKIKDECILKFGTCRKKQIEAIDVAAVCASGEVLAAADVDKNPVKSIS